MMSHIVTATIGAALALTATTASTGAQQDFPTKPVQLMVAYPPGGAWQFVRVVHTGGNVNVCLNGRRVTSFPVAPGKLASTFPPRLGKNVVWSPVGSFFDGELDDVRVLTGALPCE